MIRILSPVRIKLKNQKKELRPKDFADKVIIHFHGGAFICMDSALHMNYTRKWANDLNVPVLSVDYRMAPYN